MPHDQPTQQLPPVQRLRVRYAKRGPARFTSHRDFARALERTLRRADIPMAYSSGFNPHPRISYANASPTSASTEAEYLELGLSQRCDPDKVKQALGDALPPGMVVLAVVEAEGASLGDQLQASEWLIDLGDVNVDLLTEAVAALLAADEFEIERMTKSGLRRFDVRSAIIELEVVDGQLRFVGWHQTPLVRPDDVVTALRQIRPELGGSKAALLHRVEQGLVDDAAGQPRLVAPFA